MIIGFKSYRGVASHKVYIGYQFTPFPTAPVYGTQPCEGLTMMTKYEKARVLGARTLQLSLGAPPVGTLIDIDPLKIAEAELRDRLIPMAVKRE